MTGRMERKISHVLWSLRKPRMWWKKIKAKQIDFFDDNSWSNQASPNWWGGGKLTSTFASKSLSLSKPSNRPADNLFAFFARCRALRSNHYVASPSPREESSVAAGVAWLMRCPGKLVWVRLRPGNGWVTASGQRVLRPQVTCHV